jgi:hypothetical protein
LLSKLNVHDVVRRKMMEVTWTGFLAKARIRRHDNHPRRVIEPELDMSRPTGRTPAMTGSLAKLMRWLVPARRATGAPMRSVAREVEEAFPTSEA